MTSLPTEVLPSGAVRQVCGGRGMYELLSPYSLQRDAKLYEWGAAHRGLRNWEKGIPFSRCVRSIFSHLGQFLRREVDPDHGDCLAAIRFWAGALIHYEEMIKLGALPKSLDDLPRFHDPNGIQRIYVSGPITNDDPITMQVNFRRGQSYGKLLEGKGHLVFCPHNYIVTSDNGGPISPAAYETFMKLDLSVIENWATALYHIGSSPGSDRELARARELGLIVYTRLDDVPDLNATPAPKTP